MGKGICHANLMAVFEPRDPHKSQDAVASIWNSSPHMETKHRDRKFSQKAPWPANLQSKVQNPASKRCDRERPTPALKSLSRDHHMCAPAWAANAQECTSEHTHAKSQLKIKLRLPESLKCMSVAEYGLNMYNILSSTFSIQPPNWCERITCIL